MRNVFPFHFGDISQMRKDIGTKEKKGGKKHKDVDAESIDVDEMLHCDEDLTVLKLEFILVRLPPSLCHHTIMCLAKYA